MLGADAVELGEEVLLGGEVLDDRLDDEIALAQLAEVGDGADPAEHRVALGGLELARDRPAWPATSRGPATIASAVLCARLRSTTSKPALAATSAMPEPMIPEPTIPTRLTVIIHSCAWLLS